MKKLNVNFDGITDVTGFLFSFAKCLAAAVKCSIGQDYEDIIATSGFAFRMWANPELCLSATSIWDFDSQKKWVENGGITCDYIGRYWGEEEKEEECRKKAVEILKISIDKGVPGVVWDISGCEWGLITGYQDESNTLYTLKLDGSESQISYEQLGKMEIPILSVLTVTGKNEKGKEEIFKDTIKLAVTHYEGKEWCENPQGLAAYDTLMNFIKSQYTNEVSWHLEYYLGTYGALKYYAYEYFKKNETDELTNCYTVVYENWVKAFALKQKEDIEKEEVRDKVLEYLKCAKKAEVRAFELMKRMVS